MIQSFTPEQDQFLQRTQIKAYYHGARDAALAYAWTKDGVQYLGDGTRTLNDTLVALTEAEKEALDRFQIRSIG